MLRQRLNIQACQKFPSLALSLVIATTFTVAGNVSLNVPKAAAHSLEEQKAEIERQAKEVEHSLEFLDAGIAESAADLTRYQAELPQAQEAVNLANANVADASAAVQEVRSRLKEARVSKTELSEQIKTDEENLSVERKRAGKIAAQAYKSMGMQPGIHGLLPTISTAEQLQTISLLERANNRKSQTIAALNGLMAAKENSRERLNAVEEQIKGLTKSAEDALAVQEQIKAEAVAKQETLNALAAKTKKLNDSLIAQKPAIEKKVAKLRAQQQEIAARIAEEQRRAQEAWRAEQAAAGNPNPTITPIASGMLGFIQPIQAPITSGFGWRPTPPGTIDFWGTGGYMHTGLDFGASCGAEVRAPAGGRVTTAGWLNNGGGNTVKIDHGIIGGNAVSTVFYHNTSVAVGHGSRVGQGQTIAYVGSTGNSTGCHAHFEVWINGQPIDPLTVL